MYRCASHGSPIALALACPHCGRPHVVMVPTEAVYETEGAYVLPLGYQGAALTA